jgi:hypothetical protein
MLSFVFVITYFSKRYKDEDSNSFASDNVNQKQNLLFLKIMNLRVKMSH